MTEEPKFRITKMSNGMRATDVQSPTGRWLLFGADRWTQRGARKQARRGLKNYRRLQRREALEAKTYPTNISYVLTPEELDRG